jgi:hypothetical protein
MPDPPRPTIGRRDGALVTATGVYSALVGFVGLTFAVNSLSLTDSTAFQLFWAALFGSFGVLTGLTMETTRSVAAGPAPAGHRPRLRVVQVAGTAFLVVALIGGASGPFWGRTLAPGTDHPTWALAGAVVAGAVGYAVQAVLTGALMGARRWRTYAWITLAESTLRLIALLACLFSHSGLLGYVYATALAEFAWIAVVLCSRSARDALGFIFDVGAKTFLRRAAGAMAGQGSSALLVVGFPLLLNMTTSAAVIATAGPLLFALALTRTPLMVPLTALQGVAVSHFTRRRGDGLKAAGRILGLVALVGVAGSGLAWSIGPWLLHLIAPGYAVAGSTLAGLTLGATGVAELTLTGVLCQSGALYRAYLSGWVVAVLVAVAVLLCPFDLTTRTIAALVIGPGIGAVVHLIGLRTTSAKPPG